MMFESVASCVVFTLIVLGLGVLLIHAGLNELDERYHKNDNDRFF